MAHFGHDFWCLIIKLIDESVYTILCFELLKFKLFDYNYIYPLIDCYFFYYQW